MCTEYENTVFLTDILLACDAFYAGVGILKAAIDPQTQRANRKGVVVLGVVEGDIHDLGKNMVKYLMEAEGFEVHDLGFNVKAEKFVEMAKQTNADIIMISLMLSSMFPEISKIVQLAKEKGIGAKIMAGGGPVTEEIAQKFGADGWALTAPLAVKQALKILKKK
ncbi:MAG: methionine synthase B12-binding module cap domain-containing protein [Promethearchaeota archaeon CR_4]|nr:MAG: methionine synthase B12-binding module cap domain-containing protein [Candidatus Lokiarchaeota archaeon CR_4]